MAEIEGTSIQVPDGWEVDDEQEGGQPNGLGEIESSDYRGWFSSLRESHHRRVIILYGPWEEGPTESARKDQERRGRQVAEREAQTLADAEKILARRAAETRIEART